MKSSTRTAALVTGAVAVLLAPVAALRAWSDPPDPRISVGAAAPATLLPGDVRDPTGRMIANAVWTGLVSYDAETGAPVHAAAESITSPDRRVWTIRLRPGATFSDGTPVTSRSFTGAWTAALREGWAGAGLLTGVAHVSESGLKVEDDRTFQVTLGRPLSGFPALLGDPAFFPMPEHVLRSRAWAAYARTPVGNGPFQMASRNGREIVLRPRKGGRPVVVRIMPDARAQYAAAEGGDLDVATRVPPDRHESMEADFGDRHRAVPGRGMTHLALPEWVKRLASPTVRHALSMAIDRSAVTEGPLGHQYSPADALVPPGIRPGHREGQCRLCVHDAKAAVAALADAGGLRGPLNLWYEANRGDDAWVRTVAAQLREELRLDARPRPVADLRKALADRAVDGPFVVHATAAYPAPVAALAPLLDAGTGYGDDYATGLVAQAQRAATPDEGVVPARLAESAMLRDMPLVPLWSRHDHLVWSDRVRGVTADAFTGLRLADLSFGE
ncbi:peptide ABC transporter substrate-binding protein [Actinomadura spongiicola]|uniref:peptide ABC transporter substrate-binding protein n=1 Tax=Actinomadura spongiicola TaxID=2303421 RepID=UPI001313D92D|nr:ABC transporter substrate-binding protein [Actinomadura spongiicola]